MAENTKKSGGADSDGGLPAQSENLEKVRDILFGSQMRDQEKRFARLEEKLAKDLNDVREESRKRLESLEGFVKKEVQSLLERNRNEATQRAEAVKELSQELREMGKALEKRLQQAEEHHEEAHSEFRQELLNQSKALRDEVRQSQQELTLAMERSARALDAQKTDRSTLAELLNEMALRLSGDGEAGE